ncbi:MAG: secondary thiamine-phosphate synthase enzyme YjbQ [Arenicellales bacterium]|nr:secondary thiamine-phosphate synthase enzyme YjbQ [Arenicellales bacterium]
MWAQTKITLPNSGRGTYDITADIQNEVAKSGIDHGLAHIFIHHTSASLIICENADPSVRTDLEAYMSRAVPDGDPLFKHTQEGPDDMSAHVRSILTQTALTIPVTHAALALGTWQGIYLWEHRHGSHTRTVTVTVQGDRRE